MMIIMTILSTQSPNTPDPRTSLHERPVLCSQPTPAPGSADYSLIGMHDEMKYIGGLLSGGERLHGLASRGPHYQLKEGLSMNDSVVLVKCP